MTGFSGKERRTNKQPRTGRFGERSKGDITCLTTSQNPSLWHPSWLDKAGATRKDFESEWLAKDNPETNPITIKAETAGHMAEQFSWVPLPCCSLPRHPFPIKSLALSAQVSPQTFHFRVLDKRPVSGPGRGSLSYNRVTNVTERWQLQSLCFSHCSSFSRSNIYLDLNIIWSFIPFSTWRMFLPLIPVSTFYSIFWIPATLFSI